MGHRRRNHTISDRDNDPQDGGTDNGLTVATGSNGECKWIEKPYYDTVCASLLRHTLLSQKDANEHAHKQVFKEIKEKSEAYTTD